jgi:hypothetical protein
VLHLFLQFSFSSREAENIRQTLSIALNEIAGVNVEVSRLKKEGDEDNTPEIIAIRKNYNSKRGTLASGADYLIKQNEERVTDTDCELMAATYYDLGDVKKAEEYWQEAIKRASNPV